MVDTPDNFTIAFRALCEEFTRDLPERSRRMEEAWTALRADCNYANLKALYLQVHSLAGSAQSFGHGPVGEAARVLEDFLRNFISLFDNNFSMPDAAQKAHIAHLLRALHNAAQN